jgi:ubiquinone/menaquinone biosynthesis C-methylase UbiE
MLDQTRPSETSTRDSLREDADIETSSDGYARRFEGSVGRWFLQTQTRITLRLLEHLPAGATILDVGGGHAQVTPSLIEAGYRMTVAGSDPGCVTRLQPWVDSGRCVFQSADLRSLPFAAASFDAAVCFRLLPHSVSWTGLIGELCRVARTSVVLDYPSLRSVNIVSSSFFQMKREIEQNTRPFRSFSPASVRLAFADHGFAVRAERGQFLFPMVLHRMLRLALVSKILELPGRVLGVTGRLGSPVIVRADRHGPAL